MFNPEEQNPNSTSLSLSLSTPTHTLLILGPLVKGLRAPGRGEGHGPGASIEPCCWHIVNGAAWMLTACLMATQLQPPPRALGARGQGRGKVWQARPGRPGWAGGGPGGEGWRGGGGDGHGAAETAPLFLPKSCDIGNK